MMCGYWVLYHTTFTAVQIVNQLLYMFTTLNLTGMSGLLRRKGMRHSPYALPAVHMPVLWLSSTEMVESCVCIHTCYLASIWWHSCGDWDHAFPVFTLLLLCIIVNANNRNREGLATRLQICSLAWLVILDSKTCSWLIARFHHLFPFCSCLLALFVHLLGSQERNVGS